MKVINFGSLNIDYVYNVDTFILPGETKLAEGMNVFLGGKGLNQSVALANAGLDVYHAGFVGVEDGDYLIDGLKNSDVNVELVRKIESKSGHTIIQVDYNGQNCILLFGGANQLLTSEYVDEVLDLFDKDDIVLLQNETNVTEYVIGQAEKKGMRIAFNAAPISENMGDYPIDKVTWLLANEIEGAAITGKSDYEGIADALKAKYPNSNIVLTLGKQGVIYKSKEVDCQRNAYIVKAKNTTGAGDTFTGYFIKGVADGLDIEDTLKLATVASALCVMKDGAAESIPNYKEVEKALLTDFKD